MAEVIVATLSYIASVGTAAAGLVGVTAVGVGALAVGIAVFTAGALALNSFIESMYEMPSLDAGANQRTVRGTVEPRKIIYGTALVSGPISFVGVSGTKNRDMYHSVVFAAHEVNAITDIHFDNQVILESQINGSGEVTGGTFGPVRGNTTCWVHKHLGQSGQTADAALVSAFTAYNSSHKGTGIAYVVTRWALWDDTQALWDQYIPQNIMGVVEGKKVYDNRTATTVFSDNPVWCLIDYMTNSDYGMGIDTTNIDWDAADDAADICDATVSVPGGTEKRYTANGVLLGTDEHKKNVNHLLSAMSGMMTYTNGLFVIRAGAYEAPSISLNAGHLAGSVSVKTSRERSERFNTIGGTFVDPTQRYKATEFPQVQLASALARDNNEVLTKEVQLPFTNSSYMAQRIAYKLLLQSDLQQVLTFPTNLAGIQVAVGSRVNITLDDFNWTDKVFMCIGWTLSDSGDGGVNLLLREDDSAAYADLASGDYDQTSLSQNDLDGILQVTAPTNLAATAGRKQIELTWTNPVNMSKITGIEVHASPTSSSSGRVKIGETTATQFVHDGSNPIDPIGENDTRYYWIRSRAYPDGEELWHVSEYLPDSATSTITATALPEADISSFSAAKIWNFDTTAESWTGTYATISHQSNGSIRITPTGVNPWIRSPSGLSIDGGLNRYVRARVKLVSGATTSPQFEVFYVTSGHGESHSYKKNTADILTGTSDWVTIEWDMHNLTAGGTDWETSTITRIRLDFYQNSTTIVDVDWIAVGRKGQDGAYYTDDVVLNDNIAVSLVAEPVSAGWVSLDGGTSYDPSAATIDVAVQAISNGSQFATVTWTRSGTNVSSATISGSGFTLQSFGSAATTKTLTVTHTASGETIDINASVVTTDVTGGAGK